MTKFTGCLLLAIGMMGLGSVANAAGTQKRLDVTIQHSTGPENFVTAKGSLGSTRNDGTITGTQIKDIGCMVIVDLDQTKALCSAHAITGGVQDFAQCSSVDPRFINVALSLHGDSALTFQFFAGTPNGIYTGTQPGICTSLTVENSSSYAPK